MSQTVKPGEVKADVPSTPSTDYGAKREGRIDDFSNVMMQDRRCRDIFCCLLFILFWAGMIVVAIFAFRSGNPVRILYGTDYEGNVCGTAEAGRRDVSTKKGLYWPIYSLTGGLNTSYGLCVAACPSAFGDTICNYDNSQCWTTYNSTAVFYRCIPTFNTNFTSEAMSYLNQPQELFNQALATIQEAWWVILSMCGAAVVLSFVWICLLRCCAGCMVWTSLLFVFVAAIALDVLLWFVAFGQNPWNCVPGVASGYSQCVSSVQNLGVSVNSYVLLAFAATLAALILIFFIIICCMCSRIRLAIQLTKEASRAAGAMPAMFFFPIFLFVFIAALVVYWLFVLLYLASAPGITVSSSLYVTSDQMKYVMIYHLFGLLWTFGWLLAIGQTTIAGAVGSWYFTYPDPVSGDKNISGWPVLGSFGRTLRYHLGSLAFGSLIIAIVQLIRIILAYIEAKLKAENANKCLQCLLCCMQCCLSCFERFLAFLNKNAYIEIALFGYSFCEGAKVAFELILRNILRMAAVDKVGDFLMFMGKVMVSASAGLGAFMLMQYYLAHLRLYVIVISIVALVSYFIATGFFAVFQMTIDTMLLCFLEDIERHGPRDDTPGKKFYMSKELYDFLSPDEKAGKGSGCCS